MPEATLRDYIWNKNGVDIDRQSVDATASPKISSQSNPSSYHHLSLPESSIPNLTQLVDSFLADPQLHLIKTLNKLTSELIELEHYCEVALINPAVVEAAQRARVNWKHAELLWERNLMKKGNKEAYRAVTHGLNSLIAAYQHTTAHKIVKSRNYIESIEWLVDPEALLELHIQARSNWNLGSRAQARNDHDEARTCFKRSILDIRYLYLRSEELTHLMG